MWSIEWLPLPPPSPTTTTMLVLDFIGTTIMVEDNNNASEILGRWCSSPLKVKKHHHHHHHQHRHHMCSGALISATTEVCKWCFWAPHHLCPPSAVILHVLRYASMAQYTCLIAGKECNDNYIELPFARRALIASS